MSKKQMNYAGVVLGLFSFLSIAIWHIIVIKGEYYFGKNICSAVFAFVGILLIVCSLFCQSVYLSVIFSFTGFCSLWGIKESRQQHERVEQGHFPKGKGHIKSTSKK